MAACRAAGNSKDLEAIMQQGRLALQTLRVVTYLASRSQEKGP